MNNPSESARFADTRRQPGMNYMSTSQDYSRGGDEERIHLDDFEEPASGPSSEKWSSPWATAIQFTPDTLIGTLITVAAALGAHLPVSIVVVIAVAHLVSDGISICLAEYLETMNHADFVGNEKLQTLQQIERNRDGHVADMIQSYVSKGVHRRDAELIVSTLAKYPDAFTESVMLSEDRISPAELRAAQGLSPVRSGLFIYAAFLIVGCLPLLPFGLALVTDDVSQTAMCVGSILISLLLNFLIGVEKGAADGESRQPWWSSGLNLTANAMLSGSLAFLIGYLLKPVLKDLCAQVIFTKFEDQLAPFKGSF